ncbi:conjugal transfer protein TrbC [Hydrogenophaga crassostreae]|jgi:type IV secretion system protein VirB2|uniref:Conjugal transfer protein TrbC n=1 Tax=Hydrogenophaga crassostreae TaxID=1763535 RepID=A0A162T735_9BURK|nr:TrbC/VirB2 family protein [Hydrogenophaga crassostreae]AOW14024.1 conjugal transfer protein TrbC [Hydrogenophaga crassostreae]OAD44014.1 conjugal transfer protein TrbC [Hydrogenophaga crassostreae]
MSPSLSLRAVSDLLAKSFTRRLSSASVAGLQRVHRLIQPARQGLLTAAVMLSLAGTAKAAGSSMPWEGPLQSILDSIQGPVARIVAVIIIIATGLALAFGDTSGGFRKLIQIVFGLSIAFAASSFFLSFFSFSGGALV